MSGPKLTTARGCMTAAIEAAKAAGFASFADMQRVVIGQGALESGMTMAAFGRVQAYWHHVAQPLHWAACAGPDERARWVRCAHRGAFLLWLMGRA